MQNLQDIHDKIFFETKTILETLCKINSKDELLAKQDLFTEVTDRIAFLRILEKNEDQFSRILTGEVSHENQILDEATEHVEFNETTFDDIVEEEVMFTNELNDFEEEIQTEQDNIHTTTQSESLEEEKQVEPEQDLIIEQEEFDYAERVAQKEKDLEEMEERRRRIVEFSRHETQPDDSTEIERNLQNSEREHAEKKFKLASIKGIKVVQQLFDIDPLDEETEKIETPVDEGSLLKSHVKTDFMEAEKRKPEFKLDLNDKVAFTKSLFAGNEIELKETIEKLNSFSNLEDAKQYLSEVYYRKDWGKVDEYAQRLWNLVENKFM
ncbi:MULTISPECIES: hypothetical protein [unclassified Kaistella]|uniref:hypothetical protein n=1 Tax=unclassified Kaistella TaxID=2762626 RepID=UPI002737131A|nr:MULTISPECIES: hypothetical protein [unclassified Kaistella]MCZ2085401.1 hypothetical protein [Flavobacteriales bacterium]MDP2452991.1 hypothetical protein [Kaistella sp. SH11-4b]MDP2455900.1 hypothetical protein [Kaistella sp. SH40-3]MDP2458804.1 hypothetical protein [Kaistella sp. SH19-2b]